MIMEPLTALKTTGKIAANVAKKIEERISAGSHMKSAAEQTAQGENKSQGLGM
jgi:hypothetical protein